MRHGVRAVLVEWPKSEALLRELQKPLSAYPSLQREADKEFEAKHAAYMMPGYYDKTAMVPYGYGTYGGGGYGYPGGYYTNSYAAGNGYYGYMTYGR